jgi:hypothetical protein
MNLLTWFSDVPAWAWIILLTSLAVIAILWVVLEDA